eukprot:2342899-Pyramimonas_sp.AAC.1
MARNLAASDHVSHQAMLRGPSGCCSEDTRPCNNTRRGHSRAPPKEHVRSETRTMLSTCWHCW